MNAILAAMLFQMATAAPPADPPAARINPAKIILVGDSSALMLH